MVNVVAQKMDFSITAKNVRECIEKAEKILNSAVNVENINLFTIFIKAD